MKLAQRTKTIAPSATLAMAARAAQLKAAGRDVLSMSVGEPDFDTPEIIKQAAVAALAAGDTKYTPVAGSVALRQHMQQYFRALYGIEYSNKEVLCATGGKQVLFNAIATAVDPGDEVLFASPYWVSYPDMIRFAGGIPKICPTSEQTQFIATADLLKAHITPKTRLLLLNSPSNPTGAAYSAAQLADLAALLRAHPHVLVISDDIYSGLVYDGPFVSLLHSAPDLRDRVLIATGVSKTFAMTGWRIGFAAGPQPWIAAISDLQGASTSGACSIAQAAAVAALAQGQDAAAAMRDTFAQRRSRMFKLLAAIPNVQTINPQGAFYMFPRISAYLSPKIPSAEALTEHLLEAVGLAVVPGGAFGSSDHVRLSFALSEAQIDDGIRRFAQGLHSSLK